MKIKCIIQNHYTERIENIHPMINSLKENGILNDDIIVISDYPAGINHFVSEPYNFISANFQLPIVWWHAIGSVLNADYVVLLCDDLTLKPNSITNLALLASRNPDIGVLGYEGGKFANTAHPYTDSISHIVKEPEKADFLIRFYFARPKALLRALDLYNLKSLKPEWKQHDDILLSLSNSCMIAPTTDQSGWNELSEQGIAFSKRPEHYKERNELVFFIKHLHDS